MNNHILELLEKDGRVSLMNDIIPLVMKEFSSVPASGQSDNLMQDFIRQNIIAAVFALSVKVVAVPVFEHDLHGNVSVVDFIYEVVA